MQKIRSCARTGAMVLAIAAAVATPTAQTSSTLATHPPATQPAPAGVRPASDPPVVSSLPDYVIGPDDVLSILFWRDKDISGDQVVRADGKITVPILGETQAAGLTPSQLTAAIVTVAEKYYPDITAASVNVVLKQSNSRKVYVMGEVGHAQTYPLSTGMTVVQLISIAGGFTEYAKKDKITIARSHPNGTTETFRFNYEDFQEGKNAKKNLNVVLQPGDIVMVP